MAGRFLDDERGIAAIVGAVLVVGILVAGMVQVRVAYAPTWQRSDEADHMADARESLLALVAASHLPAHNETAGGARQAVPLAPPQRPFTGPGGTHALRFTPDTVAVHVQSPSFVGTSYNSSGRDTFEESWETVSGTLEDVLDVQNFRLKVDSVGGTGGDGYIRVIAQDASGNHAGNFTFTQKKVGSNVHLYIRVENGTGGVLYNNPSALHVSDTISPYWIDLLTTEYRFHGLLKNAVQPLTIKLEQSGLTGSYAIAYTSSATTSGTATVGGTHVTTLNHTGQGGHLTYQGQNSQYLSQSYRLAAGALTLEQDDGTSLRVPPAVGVRVHNNRVQVTASLPLWQGAPDTVTGVSQGLVLLSPASFHSIVGTATEAALNLTTPDPLLWKRVLQQEMAAVPELVEGPVGSGNYTFATGSDWVRLDLFGLTDDPAIFDLDLQIHQRIFDVRLGA